MDEYANLEDVPDDEVAVRLGVQRPRPDGDAESDDEQPRARLRTSVNDAPELTMESVQMAYCYMVGFLNTLKTFQANPQCVFAHDHDDAAGNTQLTLLEMIQTSAMRHFQQRYQGDGGAENSSDDEQHSDVHSQTSTQLSDTWVRDRDLLRQHDSVEQLFARMHHENGWHERIDQVQAQALRDLIYQYYRMVVARLYHVWRIALENTWDYAHLDLTPLCWHFNVPDARTGDIVTYDLHERYEEMCAHFAELQAFAVRERLHVRSTRNNDGALDDGEDGDEDDGDGQYNPLDAAQHTETWIQLVHICRSAHIAIEMLSNLNAFRLQLALPVQPLHQLDTRTFEGFRPSPYQDVDDQKPHMLVCEYLLSRANFYGLRRYGKSVYRPRVVPVDEHGTMAFTYSWQRVCDIKEWVETMCSRATNRDMYKSYMDNLANIPKIIERMCSMKDPLMEQISKDRHMFSFTNGVFLVNSCRFYAYNCKEMPHFAKHAAKFFPFAFPVEVHERYKRYGGFEQYMRAQHNVRVEHYAARRIGDQPSFEAWCDVFCKEVVDTPNLEKILNHQRFPSAVRFWMYALTGRMMFDVNERDGWQIAIFVKGVAGSGKSTMIVNTIGKLYDAEDVGVLSNTFEKRFGLSPLADRLILIGPDIKENFTLDSAQFQSIVSGEAVSAAAKNRDPIEKQAWTAPLAMAGNKVPEWDDNAGSLARRNAVFQMDHTVDPDKMEGNLAEAIASNMPSIIYKCALAYHFASKYWGQKSFWSVVPSYFLVQQQRLQAQTNQLVAFLCSEGKMEFACDVEGGAADMKRFRTPVTVFREHLKHFCQQQDVRVPRWSDDLYQQPFQARSVRVVSPKDKDEFDEHYEWPRGERYERGRDRTYLEGVYLYSGADSAFMSIPTEAPPTLPLDAMRDL
jgi:hypothetical protein